MDRAKKAKIKATLRQTKQRHSQMDCKTYELKIVKNKLNKIQKEEINKLFKEAKWFRNAYINNNNLSDKETSVLVKEGNSFIEKEISLGSQIKQSIITEVKDNIKSLSKLKKHGHKVGALKFQSFCNSINLKQYGITYSFDKNYLKLQGIKKKLYTRGLKQIPEQAELCNAKLVRKASGIYLYVTCYVPKQETKTNSQIGIDFGIEHNLTLSNGEYFDINIEETKHIKYLSKKLNRAYIKNGKIKSNNHYKRKQKLQASYDKLTNKKHQEVNEILHYLNSFDLIAIQDEMIKSWYSGLYSKKVQHSAMGIIKARLKNNSKVFVVDKKFPSTQICPICNNKTKHPLNKRDYDCDCCHYHYDSRDVKAAQSILDEALRQLSMERRNSLVEAESNTQTGYATLSKFRPMKQEAHKSLVCG